MNTFSQQLVQVHLLLQIKEVQDQIQRAKQYTKCSKQLQTPESQAKRSRWTAAEDQLLVQQIRALGIENYKQVKMESKSSSQVYFRLRYLKNVCMQDKELISSKINLNCFQKFPTSYK
ncbi:SANT/Myb_domain [Hexamita inflata]|uniref:SANT/Myb domain n=1 Tax=Hexamita inflata TaxID=28002 RepID=A0AA86NF24_9EUKA|nr:SANT/Myb domain [Hexamita inflata]CAI9942758.1 SANT/Myb domain [Hexamita inflata]